MSAVALFAVGTAVTLLVGLGVGLLVYGAILDGRDEAARLAAQVVELQPRRRPAA